MSNRKSRIHNTDVDNLISNLRGEVGEIVSSWVMMRGFITQYAGLRTGDHIKDMANPKITTLDSLMDRLEDDIVARLAELAEQKVGRLTFYFAHLKLGRLEKETGQFTRYIEKNRFQTKRNSAISHKELPEKWQGHKTINIPYGTVVKGVVMALRLMKRFDDLHLGPRAKYLWREMRKRRYQSTVPAQVGYLLLPHLLLSADDRMAIIREETLEGRDVWKDMPVRINGEDTIIPTYGELGAIAVGGQIVLLGDPFIELSSIDFPSLEKTDAHGHE